jgi:PilZ domain
MPERSENPMSVIPKLPPSTSKTTEGVERRQSCRYPFTAAAEVVELRSQTRVIGRSSDLGSGGCYIDTLAPVAVGTVVRVRLEHGQHHFEAVATVSYAHLSMGMGLAFTQIDPENQALLQKWVGELSGELLPDQPLPAASGEPDRLSEILNLQHVLNELISMMIRKKVIDQNEGAGLLRQIFR